MPQPINYMGMFPSEPDTVTQPFLQAVALWGERNRQDQLMQQQAIAQRRAQEAYAADLRDAINEPTQQKWAGMIAKYPQAREAFKDASGMYTAAQKDADFYQGMEVSNALENGNPEVAKQRLQNIIDAKKNAGQPAGLYDQVYEMLKNDNTKGAQATTNMVLSHLDPDKFNKIAEERRKAALAPLELRKAEAGAGEAEASAYLKGFEAKKAPEKFSAEQRELQSRINERAARLKLDRDRLNQEMEAKRQEFLLKAGEIPEGSMKLINESAADAATSKLSADRMGDMAGKLSALKGSWGKFNSFGEWAKSTLGEEDARSLLQKEYIALVNKAGIREFKASGATGSMSDADMKVALAGPPASTANPEIMAQYIRGMEKLQRVSSAMEEAKAEWLSNNKHLGKAKSDIDVMGIRVPQGSNYAEFTTKMLPKLMKAQGTPSSGTGEPSYMEWAKKGGK